MYKYNINILYSIYNLIIYTDLSEIKFSIVIYLLCVNIYIFIKIKFK